MQALVGNLTLPASAAMARCLRVKITAGQWALAGATDQEVGTLDQRALAAGDAAAVVPLAPGVLVYMVAAGAITQFANVYGAADGKIDDISNENYIGIAWESAAAAGDIIQVLRLQEVVDIDPLGDIGGNVVIDDDFIGDFPAAGTALAAQSWSKTETNGLGVISQDAAGGVIKFSFDAVAEAATATLFMENSPIKPTGDAIFECILAVYDKGDNAALDIDFGLASDDHATDFEAVAEFVAFHLDGNDLSLKCHSDDGTTDTAAVDSTVDLVDDTYYAFKIDCSDLADIKFYYRALTTTTWTRVCSATTFSVAAATANWTPIVMVEKTSDDTTADVRVDRIRVQANR